MVQMKVSLRILMLFNPSRIGITCFLLFLLCIARENYNETEKAGDDVKGIPNFWLQALTYFPATREFIEYEDMDALRYLTNISCEINEGSS